MKPETILVNEIIASLKHKPENWACNEFRLFNITNKYQLWIASGYWLLRLDCPFELHFGLINKYRLWRAVKAWLTVNYIETDK